VAQRERRCPPQMSSLGLGQWVEWRKTRIAENGDPAVAAHVRSYKDWVRTTGAKAAAGMGDGTVPQTPE
jgi:hypothetical protein